MSSIFQLSNDSQKYSDNKNKSEISDNENKIRIVMSIHDIEKTIPQDCLDYPQIIYQKFYTEYRWRYFKINNEIYIEMSYKEPNKERLFMSPSGEWIEYKIDPELDNFIIKKKYYYV